MGLLTLNAIKGPIRLVVWIESFLGDYNFGAYFLVSVRADSECFILCGHIVLRVFERPLPLLESRSVYVLLVGLLTLLWSRTARHLD